MNRISAADGRTNSENIMGLFPLLLDWLSENYTELNLGFPFLSSRAHTISLLTKEVAEIVL